MINEEGLFQQASNFASNFTKKFAFGQSTLAKAGGSAPAISSPSPSVTSPSTPAGGGSSMLTGIKNAISSRVSAMSNSPFVSKPKASSSMESVMSDQSMEQLLQQSEAFLESKGNAYQRAYDRTGGTSRSSHTTPEMNRPYTAGVRHTDAYSDKVPVGKMGRERASEFGKKTYSQLPPKLQRNVKSSIRTSVANPGSDYRKGSEPSYAKYDQTHRGMAAVGFSTNQTVKRAIKGGTNVHPNVAQSHEHADALQTHLTRAKGWNSQYGSVSTFEHGGKTYKAGDTYTHPQHGTLQVYSPDTSSSNRFSSSERHMANGDHVHKLYHKPVGANRGSVHPISSPYAQNLMSQIKGGTNESVDEATRLYHPGQTVKVHRVDGNGYNGRDAHPPTDGSLEGHIGKVTSYGDDTDSPNSTRIGHAASKRGVFGMDPETGGSRTQMVKVTMKSGPHKGKSFDMMHHELSSAPSAGIGFGH